MDEEENFNAIPSSVLKACTLWDNELPKVRCPNTCTTNEGKGALAVLLKCRHKAETDTSFQSCEDSEQRHACKVSLIPACCVSCDGRK